MITMARVIAAARVLGEPLAPTARLWDAIDDLEDPVERPASAWWETLGKSGPMRGDSMVPPESGIRRVCAADLDWEETG